MNASTYDSVAKIWRGPSRPLIYNPDVSLGYLALSVIRNTPDRVMQINADNGNKMTCGEIYANSIKIAKVLNSMGLKQHDVVGIIARNSENLLPIVIACLSLGLPINPLATIMNESEIVNMFAKTRPKVIFCDADIVTTVRIMKLENCKIITVIGHVDGFQSVDELLTLENADNFAFPELINIASTAAVISCSSGTTDSMKGVIKTHKCLISNNIPVQASPDDKSEILFFPAQLYWTTAVISIIFNSLYGAKRIITTRDMTPEWFEEIVDKFKPTFVFCSPAVQYPLIKCDKIKPMMSPTTVFLAGVAITEDLVSKLEPLFPNARVVGAFGTTEGDFVTFSSKPQRGASSGNVVANYQIKIIDEAGNHLGPNEHGEICFKPLALFGGYFGEPEKSANAVENGWISTGDLGYFDNDGYIFIVERIKHMLKSTTMHFTPQEIEKVIDEIKGVAASAVVGVFDEGNDVVYAFVIKHPRNDGLTAEFIKKYVNSRVHKDKCIRGVHFVKKFPVTATGKLRRSELKEMAKKIHENTQI